MKAWMREIPSMIALLDEAAYQALLVLQANLELRGRRSSRVSLGSRSLQSVQELSRLWGAFSINHIPREKTPQHEEGHIGEQEIILIFPKTRGNWTMKNAQRLWRVMTRMCDQ